MRGMKLPRFSLRTLFVLITLISLPMAWVAYQLNWIHQRHEFIEQYQKKNISMNILNAPQSQCPWFLRLLGEQSHSFLMVKKGHEAEGQRIFPEAMVADDPFGG
jgi:hypothetical protein